MLATKFTPPNFLPVSYVEITLDNNYVVWYENNEGQLRSPHKAETPCHIAVIG